MLGALFPEAQFIVTGVLGPQSNAHGPNEFLHIAFTKRIISAVAIVLAAHGQHVIKAPASSKAGTAANVGAMSQTTAAANADRAATLQIAADKAAHAHSGAGCCP
jgi:hypothetical protein